MRFGLDLLPKAFQNSSVCNLIYFRKHFYLLPYLNPDVFGRNFGNDKCRRKTDAFLKIFDITLGMTDIFRKIFTVFLYVTFMLISCIPYI